MAFLGTFIEAWSYRSFYLFGVPGKSHCTGLYPLFFATCIPLEADWICFGVWIVILGCVGYLAVDARPDRQQR